VNRVRFNKAIDRIVGILQTTPRAGAEALSALVDDRRAGPPSGAGADHLAVRSGDRLLFLRVQDIDWIEAADDKVRIHVGRAAHDHRATMAQMESRLPATTFVRIHRSTIVNVGRIREFIPWFQGDWILVLADGTRLQSGKSYRARLRELIGGS
jgi:two-component system LytT family response regulator